ncbi:MAG: hypothetical protein JSW34_11010 [Candidatus Zixiibacteriota bacterium]|nr:MAG: hypothetical protein JSW34_11010 [candidate division Zixibacteria bacterium]
MNRLFYQGTRQKVAFLAVLVFAITSVTTHAADIKSMIAAGEKPGLTSLSADVPVVLYSAHTRGNMQLVIGNNGTFGTEGQSEVDPFTGQLICSCVYPRNTNLVYLWVAALWVGAVVGRDTLVSVGTDDFYCTYELWPDPGEASEFTYQTIDPSSKYYSDQAHSEQDIICYYTDTVTDVNMTRTGYCEFNEETTHRPLNIKATQRSMAWSYDYADDFIMFDYRIENIGHERLENVYMGIWIDGDVWHLNNRDSDHWTDDLVGFYPTHPAREGCGYIDTVNIAYHTDNDGDPIDGAWNDESPLAAVGARVVRTPSDSLKYSYNWWIINYGNPSKDFGPRRLETPDDPWRDFGPRMGTPVGDRNRYYIMRHDEFDYDLIYTALDHTADGWLPPPEDAVNFADGFDVRNLLSFGPFDIDPGEKLPITFAWVGGDNIHVRPDDFESSWDPYNPHEFHSRLDFTSFATNARWASWIYDNPGVDSDGDGYCGKFRVCCYDTLVTDTGIVLAGCDTTWYEGDGVADLRGASPPPPPDFWITPGVGNLTIRFNGQRSETTGDRFSGLLDFEGYRVYLGHDERAISFSLVASFDRENYNKYVYDVIRQTYRLLDEPFSPEQLQELYGTAIGDDDFQPLEWTVSDPYVLPGFPDSIFYFTAQDYNQCLFGVNTPITKVYPEQPYPSDLDPLLAQPDELTEEGRLKYFEYEVVVEDLLPTIPYYVNVTAFDFGSPKVGLGALESPVAQGAQVAYPLTSVDRVEQENLQVYVYPNPYRADADYEADGLENPDGILSADRMRRIHFANLPRVCKIYIYSLDGDLVREIDHDFPDGGPEAMHDTWDLITRNTQAAVSGIYYWVVESDRGTQIGKFVIIK